MYKHTGVWIKKKTIVAERVIDDFALFQSHFVHDSLLLRDCQVTVIYLGFVIFQKLGESNLLEGGFICNFSLLICLSITLQTSKFTSSSRCNWTGISTVKSNGSWNDKHSCHFSTAKEISAKAAFFFM